MEVGREAAFADDDLPIAPAHDSRYVRIVVARLQSVHQGRERFSGISGYPDVSADKFQALDGQNAERRPSA
jgi:hypothetical protein